MGYQRKMWVEASALPPVFSAQQIAAMSMEEYAKHRTMLLAEARLAMRGKSPVDILKSMSP